jgi:hypothetical protein
MSKTKIFDWETVLLPMLEGQDDAIGCRIMHREIVEYDLDRQSETGILYFEDPDQQPWALKYDFFWVGGYSPTDYPNKIVRSGHQEECLEAIFQELTIMEWKIA